MVALLANFSYAESAKALSSGNVEVSSKIATCETLLSKANQLCPHPAPLLIQHTTYALQSTNSQFDTYHAQYWQILTQTLQLVRRSAIPVPSLPQNLFSCAARHLSKQSPTKQLTTSIAQTLASILQSEQHVQSLATYSTLLAAVLPVVTHHTHLDSFYVNLLHVYREAQLREPDARKRLQYAVPLLQPAFANGTHIHPSLARIFVYAFFHDTSISKQPLYQFFSNANSPKLSHIVRFLVLTSISSNDANKTTHYKVKNMGTSRKREYTFANQEKNISQTLDVFLGILNALKSNLRNSIPTEDRNNLNLVTEKRVCLSPDIESSLAAISTLLQIGKELNLSRYETDILMPKRPQKKIKLENNADEISSLSDCIQQLYKICTQLLKNLNQQQNITVEKVAIVSDTLKSILSFSLENVEKEVSSVLEAWVTWRELDGILDFVIPSRRDLVCALIEEYSKRRSFERFLHNLCNTSYKTSLLRLFNSLLTDNIVQKKIAEAVADLPREAWMHSLEQLRAPLQEENKQYLPWVLFLISLIIETNNESEKSKVVTFITDLTSNLNQTNSEETRCGLMFLFSSVLLMIVRGKVNMDDDSFRGAIQRGVFSACCKYFNQQPESRNPSKFHISLVAGLKQMDDITLTEAYCSTRLLCALLHFLVSDSSRKEDQLAIRETLLMMMQIYIKSCAIPVQGYSIVTNVFQTYHIKDVTILTATVADLFDFFKEDKEFLNRLKEYMSYALTYFSSEHKVWENMLEKQSVRNIISKSIHTALMRYHSQLDARGMRECDLECKLRPLLEFLQTTSGSYLISLSSTSSEEKDCWKSVIDSLQLILETCCCSPSRKDILVCLRRLSRHFPIPHLTDKLLNYEWNCNTLKGLAQSSVNTPNCSAVDSVKQLFRKWTSNQDHDFQARMQNYINMLDNMNVMFENCEFGAIAKTESMEHFKDSFHSVQSLCIQLLEKDNWCYYTSLCDAMTKLLRLHELLTNLDHTKGEHGAFINICETVSLSCKQFVSRWFNLSVQKALDAISAYANGDADEAVHAAGTNFLQRLCTGKPMVYTTILSKCKCVYFVSILMAKIVLLLEHSNIKVRWTGANLLNKLVRGENHHNVEQIGMLFRRRMQLTSWKMAKLDQMIREGEEIAEIRNLASTVESFRGSIIGGAYLLCMNNGECDTGMSQFYVSEEVGNEEMKELAQLESHENENENMLERAMIESLTTGMLETVSQGLMLKRRLRGLSERVREEHNEVIKYVSRGIDEGRRYALQACEASMERKAPYRLSNEVTQIVLGQLRNMIDGFDEIAVIEGICNICRRCVSSHGVVGKWAVGQILCSVSKQLHRIDTVETCKIWKNAVEVLCGGRSGYGRLEILRSVIAESCKEMNRVKNKSIRMEMLKACAFALGRIGEDQAKLTMAVLDDETKNILREARELYVEEMRYTGK